MRFIRLLKMSLTPKLTSIILLTSCILILVTGCSLLLFQRLRAPLAQEIPGEVQHIRTISRLDSLAQLIQYYDEVLTQSARNYAFTGDTKWRERYKSSEPLLDTSIKEAIAKGDTEDKQFFDTVNQANLALVDLEYQSIALTDARKRTEAIAVLGGTEYARYKQEYKAGLDRYVERRGVQLDKGLEHAVARLEVISANTNQLITRFSVVLLAMCALGLVLITMIWLIMRKLTTALWKEKARMVASINSLPLGFMALDADGTVQMVNPLMNKCMGVANHDIGEKVERTQSPFKDEIASHAQQCLATNTSKEVGDLVYGGRDYRVLFAPVSASHGASQSVGVVVLAEDITQVKMLDRARDEFFSIASHELRTPLTAIRGNAALIRQLYENKEITPDLAEMIQDIHRSSVRLIDIVNDFLSVSRLEQGKMEFKIEDVQLEPIIQEVIKDLKAVGKEQNIYIQWEESVGQVLPVVRADGNRVKQVLYNLIGNAAKFVEEGGVKVSAEVHGSFIKVLVTDTGNGISPEGQQLLFRKFQQANRDILTRDSSRGTGLGLYISKLLVEKMGGQIALEQSEVGKGSTFSFTLPRNAK